MILKEFPDLGESMINSLHFKDDTWLSKQPRSSQLPLRDRREWGDTYHLEIHPDKSIFYKHRQVQVFPVYKGNEIKPNKALYKDISVAYTIKQCISK